MRVSVVIPALNEERTLEQLVRRVMETGHVHEVLIVDDGSVDRTAGIATRLSTMYPGSIFLLQHRQRCGKGAAVATGLRRASGDVVIVQDADLEYDPGDYSALLAPFQNPEVQVVYGSRNLRANARSSASYYWGGRLLSGVTNLLFRSRITDEATGYKVARLSVLKDLDLRARGFDFCAEVTGKLLRRAIAIHEVPISYRPRTFAEGKKIRWRDGAVALWVLLRERFAHVPSEVLLSKSRHPSSSEEQSRR